MDSDATSAVIDLISGRWRSQILFVGASLGVFDALDSEEGRSAEQLCDRLDVEQRALYRLLRALASLGLITEEGRQRFKLNARGACLRADHPNSLRAMAMLEEGPTHYAAWRHLSDIVRSGVADGFKREFGVPYWQYLRQDPDYAQTFSEAMSSYSAGEAPAMRLGLKESSFGPSVLCDIGGSHGVLMAELLQDQPKARAIVFDLPEVIASRDEDGAGAGNVASRIEFVGGDMFEAVPTADVYFLKHILHDWSDDDCLRILSCVHRAAKPTSRIFLCEFIVPGPEQPHFAKLFDIHMMVVQDGRQRTLDELSDLLTQAGWRSQPVRWLHDHPMSVLEGKRA